MVNPILSSLLRSVRRGLRLGGILLLTGLAVTLLTVACSLDENRFKVEVLEIEATLVDFDFENNEGVNLSARRDLVDGTAQGIEWDVADYTYVPVSAEFGTGGGSFMLGVKAVYQLEEIPQGSDPYRGRLFVLLQWPDARADRLGPRLIFDPETPISGNCDPEILRCRWRLTDQDEDRAVLMFDMGDAGGSLGSFGEIGCAAACHGNMHPLRGAVDLWHWHAARTNPLPIDYVPGAAGVDVTGYADDEYASAGGRVGDVGEPFFRDNFVAINCGDGTRGYRPLKISDAIAVDGTASADPNEDMAPCDYTSDRTGITFTECTTRNPCREFEDRDVLNWVAGDDLPATLLKRPLNTAQRASRHDIEARGRWQQGVWTLELSRGLLTGNSDDVQFDLRQQRQYTLSIAIMNNSGAVHTGTPPIRLTFPIEVRTP